MPLLRSELSPKGDIIRKLGYFAIGIAIGFTLLGLFQKARTAELAKRRAAAAEAAKQPFVPGLPVPPGADVVGTAPSAPGLIGADPAKPGK
jgi:hypothetical protein